MLSANYLSLNSKRKLPIFVSSETSECGFVCVAMIANYHGYDVDLNIMRQRFSVSLSGSNLRGLMSLADKLSMSSRAIRVELSDISQIKLPAIVHWDLKHFVVLKSVTKNKIVIHNPATGKQTLTVDEFSNHFTGIALELSKTSDFKEAKERKSFRLSDLFTTVSGHKESIIFVISLSIFLQLLSFALPFQLQLILDKGIPSGDSNVLVFIALGFGGVIILNSVLVTLREWSLTVLSSQFVLQIAANVFRHLIRLPGDYFERRHLGDILSRLGSISHIQSAITQGVLSALIDGTMVILAGIALIFYSIPMAIIVFASVFISTLITISTYPLIKKQSERAVNASARESSFLMETIRGIIPVKLFSAESVRESSWLNLYGKSFNETLALSKIRHYVRFSDEIIYGLQLILLMYIGANSVISNDMTIGMFMAFLAFRSLFSDRIRNLIAQLLEFGSLVVFIRRLGDVIVANRDVCHEGAIDINVKGEMELQNVSFKYGDTDPNVLENVNLRVNNGDFIAIVGPSGGGKSTLFKLLLGLQAPQQGEILIDGKKVNKNMWQSWRTKVGVVRQDDQLFTGSLAENISFFDPDMDMQRVMQAAITANVHDDIENMPTKYLTPVGDMGSSLSGGQKQRVLLARALYNNPSILFLDEGTANLDEDSENFISETIVRMNITRIVIAHRPALVKKANRVIKVAEKQIISIKDEKIKVIDY